MERVDVITKRLKDLREWGQGLEHPDLPVWHDDPLCVALWIWTDEPPEERRRLVAERLRRRIERLEDKEEREALLALFRIHPGPEYQKVGGVDDRRELLSSRLHCSTQTIKRRELTGIERIASGLVADFADPIRIFGRRNMNVYNVMGRPMAKWRAWVFIFMLVLFIFGIGFAVGMITMSQMRTGLLPRQ